MVDDAVRYHHVEQRLVEWQSLGIDMSQFDPLRETGDLNVVPCQLQHAYGGIDRHHAAIGKLLAELNGNQRGTGAKIQDVQLSRWSVRVQSSRFKVQG